MILIPVIQTKVELYHRLLLCRLDVYGLRQALALDAYGLRQRPGGCPLATALMLRSKLVQ